MKETRYFCPNCGTELKQGEVYYDERTNYMHVEKCSNCSESVGDIAQTSDDIDDIVEEVAGVNVFDNSSVEYNDLMSLEHDAWDYLVDELLSLGYTMIAYNNLEDKFVVC